jgi:hypothetical protein
VPGLAQPAAEPPPLEDWWLVRDEANHTGWMLAGRLDVDMPDEVAQYGEGQRFVGAYPISTVVDEQANTPGHKVTEYVTVLTPPKPGLPFDFDQVRVFVWSLRRHRYETGFRLHPIQGFLPVKITRVPTAGGSEPAFSFFIATGPDVVVDPGTGITRPSAPRTLNYVMENELIKRVGPDMGPIPITHGPKTDAKSKAKAEAKKKHK